MMFLDKFVEFFKEQDGQGGTKLNTKKVLLALVIVWLLLLVVTYYLESQYYNSLMFPVRSLKVAMGMNEGFKKSKQSQSRESLVSHKAGYQSSNNEHLTSNMVLKKEQKLSNLGITPKKIANFNSLVV